MEIPTNLHLWTIGDSSSPPPLQTDNRQLRRCSHDPHNAPSCPSCGSSVALLSDQVRSDLVSYKGNSDPFCTQLIKVDASTNLYIGIGLKYLESHIWSSVLQRWCTPRGCSAAMATKPDAGIGFRRRDEASALKVPQDAGRLASVYIHAGLAYSAWALFATTGSRQHQICATKYTAKCLANLRH